MIPKTSSGSDYFGEGITVFRDKIIMLTWKKRTLFEFSVDKLELLTTKAFSTTRNEGWYCARALS